MSLPTPPETRALLVVVAALIERQGRRLLLAQRPIGGPLAGQWEFPGGKLEPGESPEAALERECLEELGCRVEVGRIYEVIHANGAGGSGLLLLFYRVRIISGEPRSMEGNALAWATPEEMAGYDLLDADRALPRSFVRDFPHFIPAGERH